MPLSYVQLEQFYEGLVTRARAEGITCAITSGMACVAFGVAPATKDCDLLCAPEAADRLLRLLNETEFAGVRPRYRGHLSPPLEIRWLRGGWTSHFVWAAHDDEARLDLFGVAPRASSPWELELQGLYAGAHTVAEMKRTDRGKDWPFATALGVKLLEAGDPRGWLHLFDYDVLVQSVERVPCPPDLIAQRPVLELLLNRDARLEVALKAEVEFWHRLDRLRMRVYERAVRPYLLALRRETRGESPDLRTEHQVRVEQAERLLPMNPLRDYGVDRLAAEARIDAARFVPAGSLEWLPDVSGSFIGLG